MAASEAVDARQRNGSPSSMSAPIAPWLQILPRELWGKQKDYFVGHIDFTPLAANSTQSQGFGVSADADFVILYGTRIVTAVDNVTFIANVPELVTLTDTGSGRNLMSSPIHMDELFGTAQLPAYWAFPKLIRAGSTLTATIQSLEATARNVRLSFHGFKVFSV